MKITDTCIQDNMHFVRMYTNKRYLIATLEWFSMLPKIWFWEGEVEMLYGNEGKYFTFKIRLEPNTDQ